MVFSSITFVYAFFPLVAVAYYLSKNRVYRNVVLLLASLLFYSWGEPRFLLLMLAATLAAYCGGLLMERSTAHKRLILIVTVVLLVGNLFVFKYLNFFSENLSALFGWRALPKLIAGPIVRYETVEQEILERRESIDDVAAGLRRFILGLAKKVILANNIARIAETIYAGDSAVYGTTLYWLAAVAYALQIYFDFSGYSDMAIGLGRMFGFHFLENFDHPYTALSITDFWRRWHISLSTWFRDYVYIPLGGNRVKKSRWIRNILVVWALTGFWHGAQWNFLFWGLYYGLLLLAEKLFLGRLLERLPKAVRWLYTAFFVLIGWVLFDLTDFPSLCHALKLMFVPQATDWVAAAATNVSLLKAVVYLPLGIVCCLPLLRREPKSTKGILLADLASGLLLIVCIVFILSSSYNPFIYFRF